MKNVARRMHPFGTYFRRIHMQSHAINHDNIGVPIDISYNVSTHQKKHPSYSLIRTSNSFGQLNRGVEQGPRILTENVYFKTMMNDILPSNYEWFRIFTKDNVYTEKETDKNYQINNINNIVEVEEVAGYVYSDNVFSNAVSNMTINLMGDHSAAIGTINANINNTILVWIDSKPDIEIPMTSMNGNMNEMQLGFMTGLAQESLSVNSIGSHHVFSFITTPLEMKNIIYIGSNNRSRFAQRMIEENDIMVIDENSSYEKMIKFQNKIRNNQIHISVDVSVFSEKYFPCANSSVRGNMSHQFVSHIISECANLGDIKCLDIAEFNPTNVSKKTINRCVGIIVDNVIYPAMVRS